MKRTGKKVAIVGSGPAGLTAADQLNQAGHSVVVYERHNKVGGLLRYGIPDFKLEKNVIDRRIALLEEEGILFKTGVEVGLDVTTEELDEGYDAIILCCGASQARDLPISGRDLQGIHFAWDFLNKQNQLIAGEIPSIPEPYSVANRNVVVIGGGDTGSDCIGTSVRQGAKSIIQLEVLPRPELERSVDQPWPYYPMILKVTTSHEEGAGRHWSIMTKRFTGTYGHVSGLETVEVKRDNNGQFQEIPNSSKMWPAERILLAIGYTGPEKSVFENLKIESPKSHRRDFSDLQIPNSKYYYAGDMRRGQSLVVWAIREGREVAQKVNGYLTHCEIEKGIGTEDLPRL